MPAAGCVRTVIQLCWPVFMLIALWGVSSYAAAQTAAPPARNLPLSQLKSGLHYSGKDVQALQADEFANPAQLWLSQGAQAWAQPSAVNGKSCVSCHGAVATSMKGVATRYPAIDAAVGDCSNPKTALTNALSATSKRRPCPPNQMPCWA
jgi:sulfur-oxidizing protein SoxA